jgi:hypothetical protein
MTTTPSRRAVLAGTATALAAGSVVNLAALAIAKAENGSAAVPFPASDKLSFADPIFALIERHKAHYDAVEADEYGSSQAEQDRLDAGVAATSEIRDAILIAPFTTLAGAAAALRFLIAYELEPFDYTEHGEAFLQRLADAIERMGVQS